MTIKKNEKMPRGVSIRKYDSGRRVLQIQFQYKGRTCKEIIPDVDPDDDEEWEYAKNKLGIIKAEIRKGEFDYAKHFPNSPKAKKRENRGKNLLVQEIAQELLDDALRSKSDNGSKSFVKKVFKPWIDTEIGRLPICELRQFHIREFIRSQPVKIKTIRDRLTGLRKVVKTGLADQSIDHNPFDHLDVKEHVTAEQVALDEDEVPPDPFTVREIEVILESASTLYGPLIKNFIQFGFYTGLSAYSGPT